MALQEVVNQGIVGATEDQPIIVKPVQLSEVGLDGGVYGRVVIPALLDHRRK